MLVRSIVAGLALSLALAAPAGAATLTTASSGLVFTAAPAIDNDISVIGNTQTDPPSRLISTHDDPVPYSAGAPLPANCADVDPQPGTSPAFTINCSGVYTITLDLGTGVDTATVGGTTHDLIILGGAGDDTLTGGNANQTLVGGDGKDKIAGGDGADVIHGGAGDDTLHGNTGDDEVRGDEGEDRVFGNEGADRVFGDGGLDRVFGDEGDDALDGGGGNDLMFGGDGADTALGGIGDDALFDDDAGADTYTGGDGSDSFYEQDDSSGGDSYDGGGGIDQITYDADVPFTLDLAAGIAQGKGDGDKIVAIEDIGRGSPGTFLGTPGSNVIRGSDEADVIDPRAGNDLVFADGGDDAIDLRDGFADRVACGVGADTVQADTLDDVASDCETVTRTDAGYANEDRAPTVAITAPSSAAVLSTVAPNTITATATDDRGIARVIFTTGERSLCADETAPYTCDYRPTSADVGRDTLVAIAVDTAGQTASSVRVVNVPRFKATSLSAKSTPKRDEKAPFTFTTRGRLALPAGVLAAAGCTGTVDVSFKAGKKTVSSRRVKLQSDCGYTSKVAFRLPRRLNPKTLSVVVVHSGNAVMEGIKAKRHTVRPR